MASIEARAFKSSSLVSEAALNPVNAQALGAREDFFFVSAAGAGTGDDFSVDEFFDLQGLSEEEEEGEEKSSSSSSSSLSLSSHDQLDEGTSFFGGFSDSDGLAIPADDIKELELWSHLMDGALNDDILACPTHNSYVMPGPNRVQFEPRVKPAMVEATRFPSLALTRRRSKRSRPISGAWSSSSLLVQPESSLSLISSSPVPGLVLAAGTGPTKNNKTEVKRLKRNPVGQPEDGDSADGPAQLRKCTHCQVEKTPQWRTGPLGPKTLCNACGVRFKSGRLFPEYRPACSPTFSSEIHSNNHWKVVEMRKRKVAEPG